jgi:hypothetical protein
VEDPGDDRAGRLEGYPVPAALDQVVEPDEEGQALGRKIADARQVDCDVGRLEGCYLREGLAEFVPDRQVDVPVEFDPDPRAGVDREGMTRLGRHENPSTIEVVNQQRRGASAISVADST